MTNTNESIWHDTLNSNFPEIAGLVDNLKTIIRYKNKYCYLDNLIVESQQSISLKAENERLRKASELLYGFVKSETMDTYAQYVDKLSSIHPKKIDDPTDESLQAIELIKQVDKILKTLAQPKDK